MRERALLWGGVLVLLVLGWCTAPARAQGYYEIQVYGSECVPPKTLMVELHSNFTARGQTETVDGVYPTNHQLHETLELTQGITEWSEVGFYVFTSTQDGHGVQWVGDHIRPRVCVPDSWGWPIGVSLSMEVGYQRSVYSPDVLTWEIRPILDKYIGRWYFAVNPALERTLRGPDVSQGFSFAPAVKVSYDINPVVSAGFEYYGDFGPINNISPLYQQQQQLFAVTDLNVSPLWEINFGVGIGATRSTDHLIVKLILGRRFDWGRHSPVD